MEIIKRVQQESLILKIKQGLKEHKWRKMARIPICKAIDKFNLKAYLEPLNCLDKEESINSIKKRSSKRPVWALILFGKEHTSLSEKATGKSTTFVPGIILSSPREKAAMCL